MKVRIGVESKETVTPFPSVEAIDCKPTTKSREMSGARLKVTLFETSRERSYPPNVKLPRTPLFPRTSEQ